MVIKANLIGNTIAEAVPKSYNAITGTLKCWKQKMLNLKNT